MWKKITLHGGKKIDFFLIIFFSTISYYFFSLLFTRRSAKKYAYENLITREMQFEKPLDEDDDDDEDEDLGEIQKVNNVLENLPIPTKSAKNGGLCVFINFYKLVTFVQFFLWQNMS